MGRIENEFTELWKDIAKDKRKSALVVLGILCFVFIAAGALSQFVIMLLILLELFAAFFIGEFEMRKFGIELVTLITVLSGYLYSPLVGGAIGVAMMIMHFILTRSYGAYVLYCVPAMGAMGLLAGSPVFASWLGGDIASMGIAITVLYNVVTAGLGSLLFRDVLDELLWSLTNLAFNIVLFANFAPIILSLVA